MDVQLKPGTYLVAVSGGIDSMTLLDILARQPELNLVVAHFDHGIRPDSGIDRQLVEQTARQLDLPFVFDTAELGPGASEALARQARYDFLRRAARASGAQAIVTAHHQDDVLETAIHNILRGTGRRGLTALKNRPDIKRPLLHVPKWQIMDYAVANGLTWREDTTNHDTRYRRNFIRHQILPHFASVHRQQMLNHITHLRKLNDEIETLLVNQLHQRPSQTVLDRYWFTMLPHAVAKEVMAGWLRQNGISGYDRRTLERVVTAAKTQQPGKIVDVNNAWQVRITTDTLALQGRDCYNEVTYGQQTVSR